MRREVFLCYPRDALKCLYYSSMSIVLLRSDVWGHRGSEDAARFKARKKERKDGWRVWETASHAKQLNWIPHFKKNNIKPHCGRSPIFSKLKILDQRRSYNQELHYCHNGAIKEEERETTEKRQEGRRIGKTKNNTVKAWMQMSSWNFWTSPKASWHVKQSMVQYCCRGLCWQ